MLHKLQLKLLKTLSLPRLQPKLLKSLSLPKLQTLSLKPVNATNPPNIDSEFESLATISTKYELQHIQLLDLNQLSVSASFIALLIMYITLLQMILLLTLINIL